MEDYPLYSTLLVLKEYEDKENYEECAIIRDAIFDYRDQRKNILNGIDLPSHLSVYKGQKHQDLMKRLNLTVDKELAIEKAKLIKIKLPVK